MAKTALIAGVSGQDGAYLSQLLLGRGYRVFGQVRCDAAAGKAHLLELGIAQDIEFVALDLLNINEMRRELDKLCPDEIYNLAGSSSVAQSFDQPMIAVEINALAAARLLEALRHANFACRFFQASTSEMFGNAIASPQNESTPFRPRSLCAVAKAFAQRIATAVAAHRRAVLYLVLRSAKETGQRRGCAVLAKTVEWVEPLLATGHLRYA